MQSNRQIKANARHQIIGDFSQFQVALSLGFGLIVWQFIFSLINSRSAQYQDLMRMSMKTFSGQSVPSDIYMQHIQSAMPGLMGSAFIDAIISGMLAIGTSWAFVMWQLTKKQPEAPFRTSLRFFGRTTLKDSVILMAVRSVLVFIGYMFFVIPGIVMSLSFAMAPFIYAADVQTKRPVQGTIYYLRASNAMMRGYRMQLLFLNISFIGWMLANALTSGLASIYVVPYYQSTLAQFYVARQLDIEKNMS
ncbi:DUF975 family protein [Weissella viridescens]|uniref:DUF975 family protein n=1 Tax=Weissella viridescens TaxID=1629 RepID=A0A3P2RLF9_WEIVI|nr:DUF975 family protein [Weissella viridescens]RRG18502.1 DUF975 family protein [Weissella viridescens]